MDLHLLAQQWLAAQETPELPVAINDPQRLALAWALKEASYDRLYGDPDLAGRVVGLLELLGSDRDESGTREVLRAIAAWVAGADHALRGRPPEAIDRLDAAAQAFTQQGLRHEAALCQVPKLIALSMLGHHEEALDCAQRTRLELIAVGDDRAAGRVEINLGSMLLRQHRHAEALPFYRHAAVRFARAGDTRYSVTADIGLAGALGWLGDVDEATRVYERVQQRIQTHGLDNLRGVVHSSRGLLDLRRGQLTTALRWLEAALRDYEAEGAAQPLAEARRGLGDAYLELNLLPEAIALYDRAIEACRQRSAPLEEAWATMQRAVAQARMGLHAVAEKGLSQAQELFALAGNQVAAARALQQQLQVRLARAPTEADLLELQNVAQRLAEAGVRSWTQEAGLAAAKTRAELGQLERARADFESLLRDQHASGPEHRAHAQLGFAQVLRADGQLTQATLRFEQAAALFEQQQASLPADEFRMAYATGRQAAMDGLVELVAQRTGPDAVSELFACVERGRARALRQAIASTAEGVQAETSVRAQLNWLQQQAELARALGQASREVELTSQLRALERDMLERQRRELAARTSAAPAPDSENDLRSLQQRLQPDEALVSYSMAGRQRLALVVRREGVSRIDLPDAPVAESIEGLRFQIDTLRHGAEHWASRADQLLARCLVHLKRLYGALWKPLLPLLAGAREVTVVPQGLLHQVPFAALGDEHGRVMDTVSLRLSPSALLWRAADSGRQTPPAPARALLLGVGGSALPHVAQELDNVATAFDRVRRLDESAATLVELRRALPGPEVLHLACHGQFRADSPSFSFLQLADGGLTAHDAASLPLDRTSLVTLSACETGLSRIAPGDEMQGLVRSFLVAGAPLVLATLWTVDDACTARLMGDFYRGWRSGLPPWVALQQAQRDLRRSHPHPYYWAAYALHGLV